MEIMLKSIGIGLSTTGTLILAFRLKNIVSSISLVVHCHETNIQQLMSNNKAIVHLRGSTDHVDEANKLGTKLLIFGFFLIIIGNLLTICSLWLPQ